VKHFISTDLRPRPLAGAILCLAVLWHSPADAAVPGITGGAGAPVFNLVASAAYTSQPDGALIYTWGYGCGTLAAGVATAAAPAGFAPAKITAAYCPLMQTPGPTLIVHEGDTVTVKLGNALPAAAGSTSIIFSGLNATATGGSGGVLTSEAAPGATVTYTFTALKPGTYAYHSGTRPDLQVEMGMYGVVIVLPKAVAACGSFIDSGTATHNAQPDYRLAASAYDHPQTCYDREYLFQLTEMDSNMHAAALGQVQACDAARVVTPGFTCAPIVVKTEPYTPNYFLVNGRSMPDDMDSPYAPQYPNQPYNGNPHMHPGETMLVREVAHGRIQHPLHIHGNHARVLARDGNMLLSATDGTSLAGPLVFTFPTVSGQAVDALFQWTGKGLNWDVYGHSFAGAAPGASIAGTTDPQPCFPDANGFYTVSSPLPAGAAPPVPGLTPNYGEWCADHNRPIPITPPDPQIVANGLWYGGTPYLGVRNVGTGSAQFASTPLPPGAATQNPSAGYAFMWHSHDEREITTNDVFPGGMMMMMIIDPPKAFIDETL
jgi:FtsP/CotA-like multicopper oxidase with cupredoxin domain